MFQTVDSLALVSGLLLVLLLLLGWRLFSVRRQLGSIEQELTALRGPAGSESRAKQEEASVDRLLLDLTRLTDRLQSAKDHREVPEAVVELIQSTFDADQAVVLLTRGMSVGGEGPPVLVVAATSAGSVERAVGEEVAFGEGELGLVAEWQETLDRTDLEGRRVPGNMQITGLRSFRTDLAAPLVVGGRTLGVIALSGLGRHHAREKRMLTLVAQTLGFGLQSLASYSAMKSKADLDGLTRILNKTALTRKLGELVYEAESLDRDLGLFLFDVDHFKQYNDRNGHAAGDRLLQDLAEVVTDSIRAEDVFGRYGGEEFLVISPNQGVASSYGLAEKLRRAIADHKFQAGEHQPLGMLSVSGGVAVFPGHAGESGELLRRADEALYRAKDGGRNRVEIGVPAGAGRSPGQ